MADELRFHLDEHIHPAIARVLRQHGIDITTTVEAGLRTEQDESHFAYAQRTGRVIVTHDEDFLRLAGEMADHAGIAYCKINTRSIGQITRRLILMHGVLTHGEMIGRIQYL